MNLYTQRIKRTGYILLLTLLTQKVPAQNEQRQQLAAIASGRIKTILGLNDGQQLEIQQLEYNRLVQRDSIAALHNTPDRRKELLMQVEKHYRYGLKDILTSDQWTTYEKQLRAARENASQRAASKNIHVERIDPAD